LIALYQEKRPRAWCKSQAASEQKFVMVERLNLERAAKIVDFQR
jgi:hypothetical protein